jgi:MFS family permease
MRKWLPLMVICAGTLMLLVDVTIVNVALPDLAADLKTSFSSMQWVVDAYALTLAALVLGTGSVADQVGHRRTFLAGLAVFATASLTCGLAPTPGVPPRRSARSSAAPSPRRSPGDGSSS